MTERATVRPPNPESKIPIGSSTLARVAEHRRTGGVARDHQRLDALGDEVVETLEGVLAHLADRLGPVRLACGVTEVDQRLVRQLVDHRPRDRESAEARVEDADGRIAGRIGGLVGHRRTG